MTSPLNEVQQKRRTMDVLDALNDWRSYWHTEFSDDLILSGAQAHALCEWVDARLDKKPGVYHLTPEKFRELATDELLHSPNIGGTLADAVDRTNQLLRDYDKQHENAVPSEPPIK